MSVNYCNPLNIPKPILQYNPKDKLHMRDQYVLADLHLTFCSTRLRVLSIDASSLEAGISSSNSSVGDGDALTLTPFSLQSNQRLSCY